MEPVGSFDAITIDCAEPLELARFWAAVFGTGIGPSLGDGPHYVDLLPVPGVPVLRFQRVPEPKVTKNRLHLDLTVEDLDAARSRLEALGGRQVSGAITEYGYTWTVMQDPGGERVLRGRLSGRGVIPETQYLKTPTASTSRLGVAR